MRHLSILLSLKLQRNDGTLHKHGPRDKPCPGSNQKPVDPFSQPISIRNPPNHPTIATAANLSAVSAFVSRPQTAPDPPSKIPQVSPGIDHPNRIRLITRVPKAVRAECATTLANLLTNISKDPNNLTAWNSLLSFGSGACTRCA